jgi:hypothetical protein
MEAKIQSVTVGVVSICGAAHLARCLDALAAQEGAPAFNVVVVYDPHLDDIPALRDRYPNVRMMASEGKRAPVELASRAVCEATGDLVLLTEDQCEPRSDWVRRLCEAQIPGRAAVGGVIESVTGASPVDWAYCYTDFFKYMKPVSAGPVPTLSVCNVAYRRAYLEEISSLWQTVFHETEINNALWERFGPLWMVPEAEVRVSRHVHLTDALYERYAFGRLFGRARVDSASPGRRAYYIALAPTLPLLVLGRLARKAFMRRSILPTFIRAFPSLVLLVLAWSWGEWLGYITRSSPSSLVVAPEVGIEQDGIPSIVRRDTVDIPGGESH